MGNDWGWIEQVGGREQEMDGRGAPGEARARESGATRWTLEGPSIAVVSCTLSRCLAGLSIDVSSLSLWLVGGAPSPSPSLSLSRLFIDRLQDRVELEQSRAASSLELPVSSSPVNRRVT